MKNQNSLLIFLAIVNLPKILFAKDSIINLNFENNHFSGNLTEYQLLLLTGNSQFSWNMSLLATTSAVLVHVIFGILSLIWPSCHFIHSCLNRFHDALCFLGVLYLWGQVHDFIQRIVFFWALEYFLPQLIWSSSFLLGFFLLGFSYSVFSYFLSYSVLSYSVFGHLLS